MKNVASIEPRAGDKPTGGTIGVLFNISGLVTLVLDSVHQALTALLNDEVISFRGMRGFSFSFTFSPFFYIHICIFFILFYLSLIAPQLKSLPILINKNRDNEKKKKEDRNICIYLNKRISFLNSHFHLIRDQSIDSRDIGKYF